MNLVVAPLLRALLGPLSIRQVDNEGDDALPSFTEVADPTSTGTRLPSFRKYSFSYGWAVPIFRHFSQSLRVPVMPLRRR